MNFLNKILYITPNTFKYRIIIYLILLLFGVLFELVSVGLVLPVIGSLVAAKTVILGLDFSIFFEKLNLLTQYGLVITVLGLLFFVFFLKTLFFLFLAWFEQTFQEKISNSISSSFFEKYLKVDYKVHLEKNSSELIRNVTSEVQILLRNIIIPILYVIADTLIFLGIIFLIISVETKGSIYLFLIYGLFGIAFIASFKKKLFNFGLARQFHEQMRIKSYINAFHGIKTVKIFNKEIHFLKDFMLHTGALNRIGKLTGFILKIPRQLIELITISSFIFLTIILLDNGTDMTDILPQLALFVAAAFRLIPCVNRFLHHYQVLKIGYPSVNKLYDEKVMLEKNIFNEKDKDQIGKFKNVIFKKISFSFNPQKKIFENLDFKIEKGKSIGVVGRTGEGKTTFLDILLGLLKPTNGSILVNDKNLQNVINQWHSKVGYVPQSTFLLDESIKTNITLEFDEDKIDKKNLEDALKYSQVSEFSNKLDADINTIIGDRGVRISGGQQQRIGIARALYKNPDLLILDESTSSLDIQTEEQIINDVLKLENTKTLVIVSHRNSTIQKCKDIYELKGMHLDKIK